MKYITRHLSKFPCLRLCSFPASEVFWIRGGVEGGGGNTLLVALSPSKSMMLDFFTSKTKGRCPYLPPIFTDQGDGKLLWSSGLRKGRACSWGNNNFPLSPKGNHCFSYFFFKQPLSFPWLVITGHKLTSQILTHSPWTGKDTQVQNTIIFPFLGWGKYPISLLMTCLFLSSKLPLGSYWTGLTLEHSSSMTETVPWLKTSSIPRRALSVYKD